MKIDVCIPTLKKELDKKVLDSIYESIPVNRILLDDSPEGRGTARVNLMKKVETEYFAFIDDDIILNEKWFEKVIIKITQDEKIGAVNGLGLSNNILLNILRHLLLLRGTKYNRGFTSNTILRKSAVEGIESLDNNRAEDFEIQKAVINNGYKWKLVLAYCKHTKKGKIVWKEAWKDFKRLVKEEGFLKAVMKI